MMTVFLVDLEAVETRYTGQWKTHVPKLLEVHGHDVHIIGGPTDIPTATTPGAFLNFGGTNIYKARQVEEMGHLFTSGSVKQGDHFLFTDAWHPGIINLKYMSELLGIKVTIHALWHAGSYDPQDFLGRLIGDAPWVRHAEKSFFAAIDYNYFATDFHINLFSETFSETLDDEWKMTMIEKGKIVRTGWPMEYMQPILEIFKELPKRDVILFPHRLAPEKQVEIFRDLKAALPQYEFIVCQDTPLTKVQYHALLATAKIVFSTNLQETLGISMYEGALVNAIPLVPDRLSYSEMFSKIWKYPSAWTESWDCYLEHKQELIAKIVDLIDNYSDYAEYVPQQAANLTNNFFSATQLLENLNGNSITKS
jgi:glycosyltransferase involved in cell wall biosynthesis